MDWRCYHLFYHSNQDQVLADAVVPLVHNLYAKEYLKKFFFLRYWSGGPHLRLRFLFSSQDVAQSAEEMVYLVLESYLKEFPNADTLTESSYNRMQVNLGAGEMTKGEKFQGNNLLIPYKYEPEYEKYGKQKGIEFAELVFSTSSDIALKTIGKGKGKTRVFVSAIFSMLTCLAELGFSHEASREFFHEYQTFWEQYAKKIQVNSRAYPPLVNGESLGKVANNIINHNLTLEEMKPWKEVFSQMRDALNLSGHSQKDEKVLKFLLTNYFHTHNNRLGLLTLEEAYLGYLGKEILDACAETLV